MIQALIFDFDGVIIDQSEALFQAYQHILKRFKVHYSVDDFNRYFGLKGTEHLCCVLEPQGIMLDDDELEKLIAERDRFYIRLCGAQTQMLPGVKRLLDAAREHGVPLGLATSTCRRNLDYFLPRLGIEEYFDATVAGDEVTSGKPDPEAYIAVCSALCVEPALCLGIEDTDYGVAALKRAGLRAVAVTLANRREHDFAQADIVVSSLAELSWKQIEDITKG